MLNISQIGFTADLDREARRMVDAAQERFPGPRNSETI
jgi:hypothetical protein